MKKTFVVILVVQFIIMISFLVYATAQRTRAQQLKEIVTGLEQKSKDFEAQLQEVQQMNMEVLRRSRALEMESKKKLEDCMKGKKK